jgi:hypothetical protein
VHFLDTRRAPTGFGADWLVLGDEHCRGKHKGDCHDHDEIVLTVVLQWNFWLHENWSVFGEPGLALVFHDHHDHHDLDVDPFVFYAEGRYHFDSDIALTLRLGFPFTLSVGVSFLL